MPLPVGTAVLPGLPLPPAPAAPKGKAIAAEVRGEVWPLQLPLGRSRATSVVETQAARVVGIAMGGYGPLEAAGMRGHPLRDGPPGARREITRERSRACCRHPPPCPTGYGPRCVRPAGARVPRPGASGASSSGAETTEAVTTAQPLREGPVVAADPLPARRTPVRSGERPLKARSAVEASSPEATPVETDAPRMCGPVRATAHVGPASELGLSPSEVRPKVRVAATRAANAVTLNVRADIGGRRISIP